MTIRVYYDGSRVNRYNLSKNATQILERYPLSNNFYFGAQFTNEVTGVEVLFVFHFINVFDVVY